MVGQGVIGPEMGQEPIGQGKSDELDKDAQKEDDMA